MTLDELVACIFTSNEVRVHRAKVSPSDYYWLGPIDSQWSDELVIMPEFRPADVGSSATDRFPWLLGVAPIDYKSRLEAELTQLWGAFEEHEKDDAVVGEVDGDEIRRSVTVYRRIPTA